jgi:hypothetical protein
MPEHVQQPHLLSDHAPAQRNIKGLVFSVFVRLWGTLFETIRKS